MKKSSIIIICLVLTLFLTACGQSVEVKADLSAYGDTPIEIVGLTDASFTVTPNDLSGLACVDRSVDGRTAKVGTVEAVGPLLNTFLANYGKSQTDFQKIIVSATDGYKTVLKDDLLEKEIILSIAAGKDPLDQTYRPLRMIVQDAASSYWTYQVNCIEFVTESD